MSAYDIYNLALAAIVLPLSYWMAGKRSRRRTLALASRIAFMLTLLAYPWDFFAIRFRIWRYPVDPGLRIYDVPLNDLIFMWLCTFLACSFLVAVSRWESSRQCDSKGKGASEERTGHN
jgi:lycopene cyclase domain-containing protein